MSTSGTPLRILIFRRITTPRACAERQPSSDISRVRQVFPSLNARQVDQIRESFDDVAAYEVEIRGPRVEVNGEEATAEALVVRRITADVGAEVSASETPTAQPISAARRWHADRSAAAAAPSTRFRRGERRHTMSMRRLLQVGVMALALGGALVPMYGTSQAQVATGTDRTTTTADDD